MFPTQPDIGNIVVLMACTVHELVPVMRNFVTLILIGQCQWYVDSDMQRNESVSHFDQIFTR